MRRMLFPRWICFLACACARMDLSDAVLPQVTHPHAGICPNEMNPNLWVDAMSTCTRECESDQECESFEKCCQNVCGNHSCVAARSKDEKKDPFGMPKKASCATFMCTQQGSDCVIWDGHPMCKCRDRCEKEPNFTCASDGMTYYNKCYMDAEACSKGITLSVVTCLFHLAWPNTSPSFPQVTTPRPTTAPFQATIQPPAHPEKPVLVSSPVHQTVNVGETVSFVCNVTGQPQPQITWEKRLPLGVVRVVMRPNNVQGNMVVTNIGQLVIYNTRVQDSGVYTCMAHNPSGSIQAHHQLTVLSTEALSTPVPKNQTRCLPEECQKPFDSPEECGTELEKVSWYYEPKSNSCFSFTHCLSNRDQPPGRIFDTYQDCTECCGPELSSPCGLPVLQGNCKAYEPRWAYSSTMHECHSFVYGGCEGNDNNFESKDACEEMCPFPRNRQCKTCRPKGKMVMSFCKSDFVILGHMTDITQEKDSGHALVTVEEIFKDEQMGLHFFGKEPLEVTFLNMDWSCPCPNITSAAAESQLIIMGNVIEGMAVLHPESYVGISTPRRVRKMKEVISNNPCDFLKAITNSPQ
ncbi:PREDICTED: WAP, Kazal, immunoglobulin, Kunitz and NTR domain-containing protein 2-like [Cyprinodon variegatus]|uniref:WAP, Kazal, immunoglobulin, Kunitz and NTR domain-containing protein 2-like n=1 Tax=Cyprinodon variegatus TaxID=28743 RepID=UPI0007429CA9|nr:PREDICTED: WAP, Kazal, immunoglobulin, Kunitz and NTR domain-containing protein 2-like [Cyprinodon variegatus]